MARGCQVKCQARILRSLALPELDFVRIATGLGVEASRAETLEAFEDPFADAMSRKGLSLIEVVL